MARSPFDATREHAEAIDDRFLVLKPEPFEMNPGVQQTARDISFCAYAVLGDEPLVVTDAGADPRFAANPLVTGEPHVRFYGGIPLVDAGGHAFGTLCVVDREPRRLRERELRALKELGAIANEELRRRTG